MGIFDFVRRRTKDEVTEKESAVKESFLKSAEKAAIIVTKSVEDGEISEVSNKLNEYVGTYSGKEQYVFNRLPISAWVVLVIISILGSVALLLFVPVAAGTYVYSGTYRQYGLFGLIIIAAVVIINIFLFRKSVKEIRFSKRYDHYKKVLKYRRVEIIDDLADMINVRRKTVVNDLKKAVKTKLIPEGHFGKNYLFFMVSDEVFSKYAVNKAVYDRYFRKIMEDRGRMKVRTRETEELLAQGEEYIGKIRDSNDIIKDKAVSEKLYRMENIVTAIFHEVDVNPAQANKLGVFINYYLPTTEKLLESYIDIDEKQVKGKSLQKAQKDITKALDSINNAFECLLERFYEEQEIDIASDISALEIIMEQEGLQSGTGK